MSTINLRRIVDEETQRITQRYAGVALIPTQKELPTRENLCSLSVEVNGQYRMTLTYYAEEPILRAFAEHMKGSPLAGDEEMVMYIQEMFNVVCGRIVSRCNQEMPASARFGIPRFAREGYTTDENSDCLFEVCYESLDGEARMWGAFTEPEHTSTES